MMCAWRRSGLYTGRVNLASSFTRLEKNTATGQPLYNDCVLNVVRCGVQPISQLSPTPAGNVKPERTVLFTHQMQTDTSARGTVASAQSERTAARLPRLLSAFSLKRAPECVFTWPSKDYRPYTLRHVSVNGCPPRTHPTGIIYRL